MQDLESNIGDFYEHIDQNVEYILENQIFQCDEISESYNELENELKYCVSKFCVCQDSDSCSNQIICFHGSNYIYTQDDSGENDQLILNVDRPCSDLIYECSSLCSCPPTCSNRLLQLGPCQSLEIISTIKGSIEQYGLTTTKNIRKNSFICEYIGELLTKEEAERRCSINEKLNKMNYIICLNEKAIGSSENVIQTFIDPSSKGNIGRYINHSCDPNCQILSVRIDSIVPKLGIFANRDISAGEEICFDYGHDSNVDDEHMERKFNRKLCYCGTSKCRKFLPDYNY